MSSITKDKVSQGMSNIFAATKLNAHKMKKQTQIAALELQIKNRKQKYGLDYMDAYFQKTPPESLEKIFQQAIQDIQELEAKIDKHMGKMESKQEKYDQKITGQQESSQGKGPRRERGGTSPKRGGGGGYGNDSDDEGMSPYGDDDNNNTKIHPSKKGGSSSPMRRRETSPTRGARGDAASSPKRSPKAAAVAVAGRSGSPKQNAGRSASPKRPKSPKRKGTPTSLPNLNDSDEDEKDNNNAPPYDASKWKVIKMVSNGGVRHELAGKMEEVKGKSIQNAIEEFKAHPTKYIAMCYQTSLLTNPLLQRKYILFHRKGELGFTPIPGGGNTFTMLINVYLGIPRMKNNELPPQAKDKYTDTPLLRNYFGQSLTKHPGILPGRGMGYCDDPKLKLFHTIEPSNVYQGMVGDCWLLSAVACLAEYKNAVQKVFRKTKNLQDRPLPSPNQYVVTLWDVNKTWKEVDYVVDERLLVNEQGQLLASKPAFASGDIWVPYLEKAVAVAMGGWDKLYSGQPTRAWAMLTGRKEQYVVQRAPSSANTWQCVNKLNPMTQQMEDFSSAVWYPTTWPGEEGANSSGGGAANMGQPMNLQEMMMGGGFNMANLGAALTGGMTKSEDELFVKLSEWRNKNYMVAAITKGTNDQIVNDGIAEAHSFSVLEAYCDLAGTGIHLLKLRNPWGKANGELVNGEFDKHKGPGWKNYPQIKSKVKPIKTEDNGVFWITKREFLQYFKEIFVCAVDTKKEASSK